MLARFSKFGRRLRQFGEKVAGGVRSIGNKAGDFLMSASGAIAMLNPKLGARTAALGAAAKGVGTLGAMAENAIQGRGLDIAGIKDTARSVAQHGRAVAQAYNSVGGARSSALERGR